MQCPHKIDGVVATKFHGHIGKRSIVDGLNDILAHGLVEMGARLRTELRAETVDQ